MKLNSYIPYEYILIIFCSIVAFVLKTPTTAQELYQNRQVENIYRVSSQGNIQVGFGEASITPDWPVKLSYGKQEPTAEYYDKTMCKVMLLEVGDVQVLLAEFDVIGIRNTVAEYIKQVIADSTGLNPKQMIVAATHNHSYPRAYKKEIYEFMAQRAVRATRNAIESKFPAKFGVGKTNAREDLNLNRAELHGIANPILYVIRADDLSGHIRGVHYNYGTHVTIFTKWGNNQGQIGPGWPGLVNTSVASTLQWELMAERYEKKNNINTTPFVMFSEGAAGDQQPRLSDVDVRGEVKHRKAVFTEKLSWEVLDLVKGTETSQSTNLVFSSKVVALPKSDGGERHTLIQTVELNDAVIATIPGELGVDLAYKYERESPYKKNILFTNSDDYLGYIVPEHLAHEHLTYQAKGDWLNEHYGVQIIDESLQLIDETHPDTPPINPEEMYGSLLGTVHYEGDQIVAIGAKRIPSRPNYAGGFWGKRTVIDEQGRWQIDELMPGTFYLYAAVADTANPAPDRLKSGYKDLQLLMYGYPVKVVRNSKTANIDFTFPSAYITTDVRTITLDTSTIIIEGNQVTGDIDISGSISPEEKIAVGAYPAFLRYRKQEVLLQQPAVKNFADSEGHFTLASLPPGEYRLAAWLDVNMNGLPEFKIDKITRIQDSPLIRITDK